MTYPTPTEPGLYWAKAISEWLPVEVGPRLEVFMLGNGDEFTLRDFDWGPRITMPEDLAVEEAGR